MGNELIRGKLLSDDGRLADRGPAFTAWVSLVSCGRGQAVKIAPSGGDISDVQIQLARR